jgi:nitrogen fixation/metabolism regulation signal transduction histidine kinase
MSSQTQSLPKPGGPPKRHLRNYLLQPRFQLKYTGMVLAVTIVIASVLGYFAYDYSTGQTRMLMAASKEFAVAPETAALFEDEAQKEDRKVLFGIIGGIALISVTLGLTGILVTHKLVGPAHKLKLLLAQVRDGHLKVVGKLRKGDELQDVFQAFESMVEELRRRQAVEIAALADTIARARAAGTPDDVIRDLTELHDRMRAELE